MDSINPHIEYYKNALEKLSVEFTLLFDGNTIRIERNPPKYIVRAATPLNSFVASTISEEKEWTNNILKNAGIPVPLCVEVNNAEELKTFYEKYKEIVVKPNNQKGGKGITVLPEEFALSKAFELAQKFGQKVLVENYITGENYRFLVLDGKVIAIAKRLPAIITGDGKSQISELIRDFNLLKHSKNLKGIPKNRETTRVLSSQNFDYNSIPKVGEVILLRLTANLTRGGSTIDCTGKASAQIEQIAIDSAKTLGLRLAGVDIISEDIRGDRATVIEVNHKPGLRIHYLAENNSVDVAREIISAIITDEHSN